MHQYNDFLNFYLDAAKELGEDRVLFVSGVVKDYILTTYVYYIPTEDELYNIYQPSKEGYIDIRYLIAKLINEDTSSDIWQSILNAKKYINPLYQEEVDKLLVEIVQMQLLANDKENIINKITNRIKKIIQSTLDNTQSQEQEFFKQLTQTEIRVLSNIIHLEFMDAASGYVIVNQLTDNYKISTPVFRSLFYKIKQYNIATVTSRGVKGTYIDFYNVNKLIDLVDNF